MLSRAPGFLGATVHKGIESPERYVLQVRWRTLEDHTVGFRGGPLFPAWRAIVGPFFAAPPLVEHVEAVGGLGHFVGPAAGAAPADMPRS